MRYRFAFRAGLAGIKGRSVASVLASILSGDARNAGSRVSDVRDLAADRGAVYFTLDVPDGMDPDSFATGFAHGACCLLLDASRAVCLAPANEVEPVAGGVR